MSGSVLATPLIDVSAEPDMGQQSIVSDPAGDAILIVPPVCLSGHCPLLIVSHGRKASPASQLRHPVLKRFFQILSSYGYVLLFSDDAGPETWGNAAALAMIRRICAVALTRFNWNGTIYTLGISMGGLSATLTAYRRTLKTPVAAVALVGGRVNLADAHSGPPGRTAAIDLAYPAHGPVFATASRGHDPVNGFADFPGKSTPVIAIVSPGDSVVSSTRNGERLVELSRTAGTASRLITVTGQHLGRGHFTDAIAQRIARFFEQHGRLQQEQPR
jgi:hypothetical protein